LSVFLGLGFVALVSQISNIRDHIFHDSKGYFQEGK